jgi:1-aminocyclopropane-1-carboxylate deaminase/D-cysteine desulfhydrase-like pyridoxal-dependent ACC family enzyme
MSDVNKTRLGIFPTRIVFHEEISRKLGVNFFIKNEFEADALGCGNKVRKLEYYLEYLRHSGITDVIADGDLQSNCCMAIARYLVPMGYNVHLVLSGQKPKILNDNFFQMKLTGASIYEIGEWNPARIKREKDRIKKICEKDERKPILIETSLTNNVTLQASIELGEEIHKQESDLNIKFDEIFVVAGTGGTHAGLEIYRQLNGQAWKVNGVSIANQADYFYEYHKDLSKLFQKKIDASKFNIITSCIGGGYGCYSHRDEEDVKSIRKDYGLILDHTYTYKCFKAIKNGVDNEKFSAEANVLFIHTGNICSAKKY